jgi:phospholipase/carboxylesterase
MHFSEFKWHKWVLLTFREEGSWSYLADTAHLFARRQGKKVRGYIRLLCDLQLTSGVLFSKNLPLCPIHLIIAQERVGGDNLLAMKIKQPAETAQACIIWMHGLGSDAANMVALVERLLVNTPIRHVCLEAPVRPVTHFNHMPLQAWYDIYGLGLAAREDREGITQSLQAIEQVINAQIALGIPPERIFLAGFSQGSAMALYTGLHCQHSLAGLICLSGYLPFAAECQPKLALQTPIFIGLGLQDTVVIPEWTQYSVQWLQAHQYTQVRLHEYTMEHSVCAAELQDISAWLTLHMGALV